MHSAEGATLCATAAAARALGRAAVRLARLRRAASVQTVAQLSPLHDYLSLNAAIRKALTDRTQVGGPPRHPERAGAVALAAARGGSCEGVVRSPVCGFSAHTIQPMHV
jgi:hypothetical protein